MGMISFVSEEEELLSLEMVASEEVISSEGLGVTLTSPFSSVVASEEADDASSEEELFITESK